MIYYGGLEAMWSGNKLQLNNKSRRKSGLILIKFYNFFKAIKGAWWMPWVWEATKDVVSCDKPGGPEVGNRKEPPRVKLVTGAKS